MSLMHTTFIDGPAKGEVLSLARSPILLRVVNVGDHFDALDQLDDLASSNESITVYRLTAEPSVCFIDGRDPKTGRRWGVRLSVGTYAVLPEQPDDATLRDNQKWRAWCVAKMDLLMPEWAKTKAVMP